MVGPIHIFYLPNYFRGRNFYSANYLSAESCKRLTRYNCMLLYFGIFTVNTGVVVLWLRHLIASYVVAY